MSAQDLVVKLLLKTGAFSPDLKKAKGQITDFRNGCNTASKSIQNFTGALGLNTSALLKFGTAAGGALLAGQAFMGIMKSSQTTGDAFTRTIDGAKGAISTFANALATFDFSAFDKGLLNVIRNAQTLSTTLDQLGNTQMSFDFFTNENQYKFEEARNIYMNPHATKEEKENAKKQMQEIIDEQTEFAKNYGNVSLKAYRDSVLSKINGLMDTSKINIDQFTEALKVDISANPDALRKQIEEQYNEFLKKKDELGNGKNLDLNYRVADKLKSLVDEYKDIIVKYAILNNMSDEELKNIIKVIQDRTNAFRGVEQLKKSMNRVESTDMKTTKITPVSTPKIEEPTYSEGSLNYYKSEQTKLKQLRDDVEYGTEEWDKYNEILKEVNKEIEKLTSLDGKVPTPDNSPKEGSLQYYKDKSDELQKLRDYAVKGTDEWTKYNNELQEILKKIEELSDKKIKIKVEKSELENDIEALSGLSNIFTSLGDAASIFGSNTSNAFTAIFDSISVLTNGMMQLMTIQDLASKASVANKAMETSANVAETGSEIGLAMAKGTESASGLPFPMNLAAIATVIATIVGIISSIKSATSGSFADGGIVGGTSWSGDKITLTNVNSGEMILNKGQQANLFRQLNESRHTPTLNTGEVEFKISGNNLVGVLNNNIKKNKIIR